MNIKKTTLIVVSSIIIIACNSKDSAKNGEKDLESTEVQSTLNESLESFREIENDVITKLNDSISGKKMISDEEILNFYKPKQQEIEGNYEYSISKNKIDDETNEYTIIETGLLDDSIEGIKSIIVIKNTNNNPVILSIKESYRCYRGHQEWSAENCN